jgi:proteic killer suppression protein
MKITFQTRKFEKAANSESQGNRLWGPILAAKVRQRLFELNAANTLAEMSTLPPPRCHQLTEDLDEQFAVDVSRNQRLVFQVADDPILHRLLGLAGNSGRARKRGCYGHQCAG